MWSDTFNSSKAAAGLFLALIMLSGGCEDDAEDYTFNSADDVSALTISPSSVTLNAGDTFAVFNARGGTSPYFWGVRDESLGTLDTNTGTTVVYNRMGTGSGGNIIHLQDVNNWTVEALITHTTSTGTTDSVTSTGTTDSVTSYE